MIYDYAIAIEGLNGSGKATQTKLLLKYLKEKGKKTLHFEFPIYESETGKLIKQYLTSGKQRNNVPYIALLYELDRYAVLPEIETAIKQEKWIVFDRYFYSNWVFQGILSKKGVEFINWLKQVENYLPKPKYKIFLDVPIEITIKLMKNKKKDWHEKDKHFITEVYEKYKEISKDWIVIKCYVDGKLKTPDEIHKEIVKHIKL